MLQLLNFGEFEQMALVYNCCQVLMGCLDRETREGLSLTQHQTNPPQCHPPLNILTFRTRARYH